MSNETNVVTVPNVPMGAHRKWVHENTKLIPAGWMMLYVQRATNAGGMSYHPVARFDEGFRNALASPNADLSQLRFFAERSPDADKPDYRELDIIQNKVDFLKGLVAAPGVYVGKNGRTEKWKGMKKTAQGLIPVVPTDNPQPEATIHTTPTADVEIKQPSIGEFDLSKIIPTEDDIQPAPEPVADTAEQYETMIAEADVETAPVETASETKVETAPEPAAVPATTDGRIHEDDPSATFEKTKKGKYRLIQPGDTVDGDRYVKVGKGKYEKIG